MIVSPGVQHSSNHVVFIITSLVRDVIMRVCLWRFASA